MISSAELGLHTGLESPESSRTQSTILIVDDDVMMSRMLSDILVYEGYNILIARSYEEAVDHLDKASFVLTDLHIGGQGDDGIAIFNLAVQGEIPVIMLTGAVAQDSEIVPGLENAEDGSVVAKPFDIDTLLERIKTKLDAARNQLEGKSPQATYTLASSSDL